MIGQSLDDLLTPCFVVNKQTVEENCSRMLEKCQQLGLKLRPMMKTHKCLEAAILATNGTKQRIAVSTIPEAELYADAGFNDILFPAVFTDNKVNRIRSLHQRLSSFHVLIDSDAAANILEEYIVAGKPWSVFIKVDVDYHRAGIPYQSEKLLSLAKRLHASKWAKLQGLYCHEGNSYACQGEDVTNVAHRTADVLTATANRLRSAGVEFEEVTMGATPSASLLGKNTAGITEIHPGNYIFYDKQQAMIGSCSEANIAGRVVTTVVGHYPDHQQMLVDAGFLALSHDGKGQMPHGGSHCVVQGAEELVMKRVTQELGVLGPAPGCQLDFNKYPVGSKLFLLPYHSCATAAMHRQYYVLDDQKKITEIWKNVHGWGN